MNFQILIELVNSLPGSFGWSHRAANRKFLPTKVLKMPFRDGTNIKTLARRVCLQNGAKRYTTE